MLGEVCGGGKGISSGWVRLTDWKMQCSFVHVGVCVCAMRMCLCVLDLLVGMGSCGKYPRALHHMSKNMFAFFCSWMLRALGVGYFS